MMYIYIYICCYIVIVLDIEFITTNVLIDTHVVIFRRGVTYCFCYEWTYHSCSTCFSVNIYHTGVVYINYTPDLI